VRLIWSGVKNFTSYRKEAEINYTRLPRLFAAVGDTGSGKSSLLSDAILLALYGTTPKISGVGGTKLAKYRNDINNKPWEVKAIWRSRGEFYLVIRNEKKLTFKKGVAKKETLFDDDAMNGLPTRDPVDGELLFKGIIWGADTSEKSERKSAVQGEILKALGDKYDTTCKLTIVPQFAFDKFLKPDEPAHRREAILEIAGATVFKGFGKWLSDKAKILVSEYDGKYTYFSKLSDMKASKEVAVEDHASVIARLNNLEKEVVVLEDGARVFAELKKVRKDILDTMGGIRPESVDQGLAGMNSSILNSIMESYDSLTDAIKDSSDVKSRKKQMERKSEDLAQELSLLNGRKKKALTQKENAAAEKAYVRGVMESDSAYMAVELEDTITSLFEKINTAKADIARFNEAIPRIPENIPSKILGASIQVVQKEIQIKRRHSAWKAASDEIESLRSTLTRLSNEIKETVKEGKTKKSGIDALNERIRALTLQREDIRIKNIAEDIRSSMRERGEKECPVCGNEVEDTRLPIHSNLNEVDVELALNEKQREAAINDRNSLATRYKEIVAEMARLNESILRLQKTPKEDEASTLFSSMSLDEAEEITKSRIDAEAIIARERAIKDSIAKKEADMASLSREFDSAKKRHTEVLTNIKAELCDVSMPEISNMVEISNKLGNIKNTFAEVYDKYISAKQDELADIAQKEKEKEKEKEFADSEIKSCMDELTRINAGLETLKRMHEDFSTPMTSIVDAVKKGKKEILYALSANKMEAEHCVKLNIFRESESECLEKMAELEVDDNVELTLSEAKKEIDELTHQKAAMAAKKEEVADLEIEMNALYKDLENNSKRRSVLEELARDFNAVNIQTFIEKSVLPEILLHANHYFKLISKQRYTFDMDDKGDIVVKMPNGTLRPIYMLSGGETFQASLAILIGIREIPWLGTISETLIIDEGGFSAVDEKSIATAAESLDIIIKECPKLQIGVITHVAGLAERIDAKIRVSFTEQEGTTVKY